MPARASAKDVLPFPGSPTSRTRFRGSIPCERSRSARCCSSTNSSAARRTAANLPPSESKRVMGMRRSRPKALGVTLTPIGLWRRLYSARSVMRTTRSTIALGNPSATIASNVRRTPTWSPWDPALARLRSRSVRGILAPTFQRSERYSKCQDCGRVVGPTLGVSAATLHLFGTPWYRGNQS